MPTYGYECQECKEQFETYQKITDEPLKVHEGCGGTLRRLVYPVGIAFKGSGFYVNDYARKGNGANGSAEKSEPAATKEGATSEAKADTKTEAKTETKTEAKTETKPEKKAETSATGSV